MTATLTEQMRTYIQTQLTSQTIAEDRVFDSRILEFQDDELPAINIWMFDESTDDQSTGYSQFHKTMTAPIEIVFVFSPGEDENPGVIRDQFKQTIKSKIDRHLGGLATCCEFSTLETFPDVEGDRPRIIGVMTFNVEFIDQ